MWVGRAALTSTRLVRTAAAVFFAAWSSGAGAAEQVLRIDPAVSQVRFRLEATLHSASGTIAVRAGVIRFELAGGVAGGEVVLSATSANTANERRDRRLHDEVLESGTYPDIVFRPATLSADVDERGTGTVSLTGTVTIHGGDHPVTVRAAVRREGGAIRATGTLTVPYVAWGLKDPSVFLLRVAKQVDVAFSVAGTLETAAAPATGAGGDR